MSHRIYIYIIIMAVVSLIIRALPVTLLRKQIKNRFVKSFLYYVPYVTLSVMTFPEIIEATSNRIAGLCALFVGVLVAFFRKNLFETAISCCLVVLILEFFL